MTPDITRPKTCPRCGAGFGCSTSGACWCAEEPYRMPMPKAGASKDEGIGYDDCLCRTCLREVAEGLGLAPSTGA
jgi:hypothetical protein